LARVNGRFLFHVEGLREDIEKRGLRVRVATTNKRAAAAAPTVIVVVVVVVVVDDVAAVEIKSVQFPRVSGLSSRGAAIKLRLVPFHDARPMPPNRCDRIQKRAEHRER